MKKYILETGVNMKSFTSLIRRFIHEENGQAIVEMVMLTAAFTTLAVILYNLFFGYLGKIANTSKSIQSVIPASF